MTLPPPPADATDPASAAPGGDTRVAPAGDARTVGSSAAIERYRAGLRRPRLIYFAIVGVVVVALAVFAVVTYARSEAAHTSLRTVAKAPPSVTTVNPVSAPQQRWHTIDRLAIGSSPISGGTVVTWSTHTMRGRNAQTGRQTWSYTRTDRTLCTALQLAGTAIAVYRVNGDCAEVSALNAGTGKRVWSRTLDEDGVPLSGTASYRWSAGTLLIYVPDAMYAIDPGSGLDRWTYTRYGCAIDGAAAGTAGVLISQDCTHPHCTGIKFCGRGRQLLLRDGAAAKDDESKPNFDKITWNDLGNSDVPLSAGAVLTAVNRATGRLDTYTSTTGRPAASISLNPAPSITATTLSTMTATDTIDGSVVWIGGTAAAIRQVSTSAAWSASTPAPLTLVGADNPPDLLTATISALTSSGVAELAPGTGRRRAGFTLSGLGSVGAGTRAYPLSTGFLVGSQSGTTSFQ